MTPYQGIRAAGKSMYQKVITATAHLDFSPGRIAKRMGLPVLGRGIVVSNEIEQEALADFGFSEYRLNGKTLAQTADAIAAGLTPLEIEVLEAILLSQSSFYEVRAVLPDESQIRLRNLLNTQAPEILLTDVGLSGSFAINGRDCSLFCRPVKVRGIGMTNGISFAFRNNNVPGLLQAYRQKTKKCPPEELSELRFIFFFQKHQQFGIRQAIRDEI